MKIKAFQVGTDVGVVTNDGAGSIKLFRYFSHLERRREFPYHEAEALLRGARPLSGHINPDLLEALERAVTAMIREE